MINSKSVNTLYILLVCLIPVLGFITNNRFHSAKEKKWANENLVYKTYNFFDDDIGFIIEWIVYLTVGIGLLSYNNKENNIVDITYDLDRPTINKIDYVPIILLPIILLIAWISQTLTIKTENGNLQLWLSIINLVLLVGFFSYNSYVNSVFASLAFLPLIVTFIYKCVIYYSLEV